MSNVIEFKGNIPRYYEDILMSFLFNPSLQMQALNSGAGDSPGYSRK